MAMALSQTRANSLVTMGGKESTSEYQASLCIYITPDRGLTIEADPASTPSELHTCRHCTTMHSSRPLMFVLLSATSASLTSTKYPNIYKCLADEF